MFVVSFNPIVLGNIPNQPLLTTPSPWMSHRCLILPAISQRGACRHPRDPSDGTQGAEPPTWAYLGVSNTEDFVKNCFLELWQIIPLMSWSSRLDLYRSLAASSKYTQNQLLAMSPATSPAQAATTPPLDGHDGVPWLSLPLSLPLSSSE